MLGFVTVTVDNGLLLLELLSIGSWATVGTGGSEQETHAGHRILPPEQLARHLVAPSPRPP
jgi:hypothetical protein